MDNLHVAALLALSSALCIAVGDVLQLRATHRVANGSVSTIGLLARLLHDPWWYGGAAMLLASIGLQAAALSQGSVLLVQALLMLSLLFALPINARLARRRVITREWIWAALLTTAVVVIVTVGHPQAGQSTASLRTWAAVAAVLGPLLAGCVVAARVRGGVYGAVLFAAASGSLWGVFAVLTKEVVHLLGGGVPALARTPELYAWLLVALAAFVCGQLAFRAGPLTASMPTLQVSQPIVAAILGVLVLGETLNTGPAGAMSLVVAALVLIPAVIALARVEAVAGESADVVDVTHSGV